jgi:hypothetical protein
MWLNRLKAATFYITSASTIGFGVAGGYVFYESSNEEVLPRNIATTTLGIGFGSLIGLGFGATWPVGITVATARAISNFQEDNKNVTDTKTKE